MFNFKLFRENKVTFFIMAVVVGLVIGVLIATRLSFSPSIDAGPKTLTEVPKTELSIEDAFIQVAKEVGPAVVGISTVHTKKVGGKRYNLGPFKENPFGEDFFDEFFKNFFEDMIPEREYKQRGLGSGVIIDEEGYILTNYHVVRNVEEITVTLSDGRKFKGEVKGTDPRSDLSVIKIEAKNLKMARLGDSDKIKIGQWAIAIGNPFGYLGSPEPTVTTGVISAMHRSLSLLGMEGGMQYYDLIQTDAAINPGNSGGPLVNVDGEVIGINAAIITRSGGYQGIGFAIPINIAKDIIGRLIEGKKVLYGWLGVSIQEIDQNLADFFGVTDQEGVLVAKVLEGSPAQRGGFKDGDIIKTFDGTKIKNSRELLKKVGQAEVGKKVKIGVIRNSKDLTLEVEIGERPTDLKKFSKISRAKWRGMEVQEITPEIAKSFNIDTERGVVISDVEPGSSADEAGLRIGDVIDEINKKPIKNLEDYNAAISDFKGDILVRTDRGYVVVKPDRK